MTIQVLLTHIFFATSLSMVSFLITLFMCKRVAIPDYVNERSSHKKIVPRAGGVAIVITFFIGMMAIYFFADRTLINKGYMQGFIFSSILIAVVSFYDDIKSKSAVFKLSAQLIATITVLWSGIVLDEISLPVIGAVELGWLGYLLSLLWIIGLTNAYNFMDGLDGLIGGVTIIAGIYFMAICYFYGSHFVYISSYTIVAGALGFLVLNLPPARIFMGDVGSVFLGFTFAVLAIIASRYDDSHISFLVIPLLLFNVIYDVIFTLLRRLFHGENIIKAHNKHLYQLMNQIGFSHLKVSLAQYFMVFIQGLGALWMLQIKNADRLYVFIPFMLLQIVYTVWIMKKASQLKLL